MNYDLIEFMLKNGANVNERYSDGSSAIHTINNEIIRFHNRGDEEKVKDFTKIKTMLESYGAK